MNMIVNSWQSVLFSDESCKSKAFPVIQVKGTIKMKTAKRKSKWWQEGTRITGSSSSSQVGEEVGSVFFVPLTEVKSPETVVYNFILRFSDINKLIIKKPTYIILFLSPFRHSHSKFFFLYLKPPYLNFGHPLWRTLTTRLTTSIHRI